MPLQRKFISPFLLILTLLAVGSAAGSRAVPPATVDAYEVWTGSVQDPWCGTDDAAYLLDEDADLRGPHFSLSLLCGYVESRIPEFAFEETSTARQLADDTELLLVQIAHAADYLPETERFPAVHATSVRAWVEIGRKRIALDAPPTKGGYLAVIVPEGEKSALWIEDAERAQGLDLRNGEQLDPVSAYYEEPGLWTEKLPDYDYDDVRFRNGGATWDLSCDSIGANVTRAVWLEDQGWAPEGKAFLVAEFWWCSGEGVYDGAIWVLDADKAMTVWIDSEIVQSSVLEERPYESGGAVYTAVFEVPSDVERFRILFAPVGEVIDERTGATYELEVLPRITDSEVTF
ncbi:hypothetical protein [Glycomyces arizonensis]|uniref:hypothetical protein n=1 Tax=Glycomyces arizonensis TaxID=256035 RepID=UPI00047CC0DC|nr:hypothetical protein [Glycomyces arizonensis]